MIQPIRVRKTLIGEGKPKIIVPIVRTTRYEIIGKAKTFSDYEIDMVEWRADFYEDAFDEEKTVETAKQLRAVLGEDMPLLYTFRTAAEGGEKPVSDELYTKLNKTVAESGYADLVDVQIFLGDSVAGENIDNIHAADCRVVGSNHDFHATPDKDELVRRLLKAADMGADIPKIAVMPRNRSDVLALFAATAEANDKLDRPIITMSMGPMGVLSRMAGEVFGSAMTFGTIGKASAPGQISIGRLRQALDILHESL